MALISIGKMKEIMDIPESAEILLNKPAKEIKFPLKLKTSKDGFICFDAFVVYHMLQSDLLKGE